MQGRRCASLTQVAAAMSEYGRVIGLHIAVEGDRDQAKCAVPSVSSFEMG